MARFKLTFRKSVAKELRRIPNQDVQRLLRRIELLTEQPREKGCIKLSGREYYRVRVGSYRIVYEIVDECLVVQIVKVANRGKVY